MKEKNVKKLTDEEMSAVAGGYDEAIVPEVTVPLQAFDPEASSEVTNPLSDMQKIFKNMVEPNVTDDNDGKEDE